MILTLIMQGESSTYYKSWQKPISALLLQNKCTRFCLNLNNRAHTGLTGFEKINWLPINDRFEQCIWSLTFKYFNNLSPLYMNDVFKPAGQNTTATRTYLFKLSQPLQKNNHRQKKSFICGTLHLE